MTTRRTVARPRLAALLALVATALVGSAFAGGVSIDATAFDFHKSSKAKDKDVVHVDFALVGGDLRVVFLNQTGTVPAKMKGTGLPLDSDLTDEHTFAGYRGSAADVAGLPVSTDPWSILMDVQGDGHAILAATLARMEALGMRIDTIRDSGPIRAYWLHHGNDTWRLSVTPRRGSNGALIHLQAY